MELTKFKTYIEHLDSLIGKECTGTADEFAQKLGISERTLQNHLQQLRGMGIDVIYDHYKRTYKYSQKGRIFFGFDAKEMSEIKGGRSISQNKITSYFQILYN
ncbi:MAG: helix-turn-helix domain-containing protein [Bacteroidales bacterium]|nr:helix-turn-helix domain-containing protein [Bacteroidales bacterium]